MNKGHFLKNRIKFDKGESVDQDSPSNFWAIAGNVLGGVFGLLLLVLVFSMMVSSFAEQNLLATIRSAYL